MPNESAGTGTDPALADVALARSGDRAAFERLAAAHREAMFRAAYHVLRNQDDALDATQDALVRAWRHLATFDGRASFVSWLRRIATNAALDVLERRRRDRARSSALPEGDALQDPRAAPLAEGLERAEAREVVRRAIDALPPAQRSAVLLRDVQGLSYEEIAAALGVAKGTVMSRIFYGRENLKEALARALGERGEGRARS